MTIHPFALKFSAALAALFAASTISTPAQAGGTVHATYTSGTYGLLTVTIQNLSATPLTDVILTDALVADPTVTGTTTIGTIAGLGSASSSTDFVLPDPLDSNPNNIALAQPFTLTVSAKQDGQSLSASFIEAYNSNRVPSTPDVTVPLAPAPEPSAFAGLALGALSLSALSLKARKRRA